MENSLKSLLDGTQSVLILLPKNPYFDQVSAGLSLYLSLKDQKETAISCPSPMTVEFNRLVGVNKITTELGSRNLVIKFSDYDANSIERVSYDVEGAECQLTVIPKSGLTAPKQEQVIFSASGAGADIVILIGGANETHFPAIATKDLLESKLIHIGTQDLGLPSERGLISLARPASSVAEVVARIITENYPDKLDRDIATNLLTGLHEGSKGFTNPQVSADTYKIASELVTAGGTRSVRESVPAPTPPSLSQTTPRPWAEPKTTSIS